MRTLKSILQAGQRKEASNEGRSLMSSRLEIRTNTKREQQKKNTNWESNFPVSVVYRYGFWSANIKRAAIKKRGIILWAMYLWIWAKCSKCTPSNTNTHASRTLLSWFLYKERCSETSILLSALLLLPLLGWMEKNTFGESFNLSTLMKWCGVCTIYAILHSVRSLLLLCSSNGCVVSWFVCSVLLRSGARIRSPCVNFSSLLLLLVCSFSFITASIAGGKQFHIISAHKRHRGKKSSGSIVENGWLWLSWIEAKRSRTTNMFISDDSSSYDVCLCVCVCVCLCPWWYTLFSEYF